MDDQSDESIDVFALVRNLAEARRRLALAMLNAAAADALPNLATPEDIAGWKRDLADAEITLAGMHDAHQT